ncbi:protein fuzzy homolog [Penaeus indicus]|uniref:protein fuzzy homolog n=1 Tax=Penaeus indicus TaxID=29960 RepID=UPI00300C2055
MASWTLVGLWAPSGVPLFVRHTGHGKPPPYALIGSLNGVHVFGESHGVTLCTTRTQNASLTWKTYHDSIRLVLVRGSETTGDSSDSSLLDLMFASLVLLLGLDTVTSSTNIERLKRDIRPCFPLLDELLFRAVGGENHQGFSHLTGCAECVIPPEHHALQVPFRMLVVQLTSHVSVVTLCGPTPSLADMIRSATSFWAPFYQVLEALSSLLPWNIAPALLTQLDNSVIGLLLVNYDHKRCVGCLHLSEDSRSRSLCVNKKSAALQSVYRSIIGPLLQPPAMPPEDFPTGLHPDHLPLESYVSTDSYKVYVLQSSPFHLLVLFPPALPIHIARQVSKRTLAVFTKGKTPRL